MHQQGTAPATTAKASAAVEATPQTISSRDTQAKYGS
jgi:hypothetical protein